ncbi:dihydropteroate synthase [Actinospongicola halichondriae]|uniref:dihydropteroate synthase n=1 Tax=Actinospongicola halichondriae TaxID=3236844 RepID=UPI003D3E2ACC
MSPLVMGVLNVTPDSFSDGGEWFDAASAVQRGDEMLADGADVIDVGGESTRPGAAPVPVYEELSRVLPVIEGLADSVRAAGRRISIDTRHADVARAAVDAGASIINDVTASLDEVAAETGAGWVAMHMQGVPGTMQDAPHYGDVVEEVRASLVAAEARARSLGVEECWIDPGIGFGKTFDHNWSLLAHLDRLVATGIPVAVGTSRKGFLGAAMADADGAADPAPPGDRLEGSVTTALWAATMGADMIRVHDVAATVRALATPVGGSTRSSS